jgi:putative ABC transport system permease protein
MDAFTKDVVYAARSLVKSPTFALTAIITIALGIGASATIFSVVNAVLLRPLPYQNADRLVYIWADLRNRNVVDFAYPPGDVYDLQQQGALFEGVAGVVTGRNFLRAEGFEPEQVATAAVTTNFFRVLGARMALGRDFDDADAALPPPAPPPQPGVAPAPPPQLPVIAVISHRLWQRRFGGDPTIVGQMIPWGNNGRAQIIGVLEPGIELLFPPGVPVERLPDVFTVPRFDFINASRNNVSLRVIARMKEGVTLEQAQAQADQVAADLRRRFAVKETAGLYYRVEPMHEGLTLDVRPSIMALMGAVIFVLLVACANVANLLLVRAGDKEREFALRAALGGSRGRLLRQVLVESLLVSLAGATLGLALAEAGIVLLLRIGPQDLPRLQTIAVDWNVALFAGLAAVAAAALFGILPALRASRPGLIDVLRTSGRVHGVSGSRWLRDGVVLAEVALSFVLLVGSGLMIRSFVKLQTIDPGYEAEHVLSFVAQSTRPRSPEEVRALILQLHERIQATPGVTMVSGSSAVPLDGSGASARWGTEEALADPNKFQQMTPHFIRNGYFEAMGTRVLEGRSFNDNDHNAKIRNVIIDSVAAKKAFPGQSAVGKRILSRVNTDEAVWFDIIGVVEHQRRITLASDGREAMFFAEGFIGPGSAGRWVVRSDGDPAALAPVIRAELAKVDPTISFAQMEPLSLLVTRSMAPTRFALVLIGVFAVVAVVLAAVGLYGVLAGVVRQRTSEIGVRMAFGAPTTTIFRLFISHGLRLSVIGVAVGIVAAFGLTRWMSSMLVGVTPTDPVTYVSIAAVFIAVAALACWLPARRAAALDPLVALREQ